MKLRFGLIAVVSSAASALTLAQPFFRGDWEPCALTNDAVRAEIHPMYLDNRDLDEFECTKVQAPLCHEGICMSNKTIELFVKRKVATAKFSANATRPQSIWLLDGGPGIPQSDRNTMKYLESFAKTLMWAFTGNRGLTPNDVCDLCVEEPLMVALYYTMNRTANVYSLDHRGVGLSSRLDCGVPQMTMTLDQMATCISKLLPEMDNHPVAYSVTSASKDVEQLIATFNQGEETFVYGASYGSYWAERVMHLAPSTVKGFILDGVMAESGISNNDFNKNLRPTAERLFEHCANSSVCPLKSSSSSINLHDQVLQRFHALDESPNGCVNQDDGTKPSEFLRSVVIAGLQAVDHLAALPYVLNLFFTCDLEAQQQLLKILNAFGSMMNPKSQDLGVDDRETSVVIMLMYLIQFSELFDLPLPSLLDLDAQYLDGVMTRNGTSIALTACVFLHDSDKPDFCRSPEIPTSKALVYEKDMFWHKTARIPTGASVLFLHGKLDFNTPLEFEELEFNNMQGGQGKLNVHFEFGRHRVATLKVGV